MNPIIEQIHKEFNTSTENALLEVQNILATASLDKIKLLEELGLTQTAEYKKAAQAIKANDIFRVIEKHKATFPKHKFITEESVKIICKKYNLVCAPMPRYKGFVPAEKLQQIKEFMGSCRGLNYRGYNASPYEFFICAPKKDLNLRGLWKFGAFYTMPSPPDPVVLYPVREGYIIVTAWGDEASDPLIK